jgi:DNA damage-binding protein 1
LALIPNLQGGQLRERKRVTLGTQPVELAHFTSKNSACVFASNDRPTVVYSSHDKLLYSNVNLKVLYRCFNRCFIYL